MRSSSPAHWPAFLAVLLLAFAAAPAPLHAAEGDLADLQDRLRKLEKMCAGLADQNRVLLLQNQELLRKLTDPEFRPGPSATGYVEPEDVRRLIAEHLAEEEKKKAAAGEPSAPARAMGEAKDTRFVVGKQTKFDSFWSNGLQFESQDKAFKIHVGGRIHNDWGWWNAENAVINGPGGVGPLQDGSNFRRARIRVNGQIYETVDWIMEYGFENGVPVFFDVFAEIPRTPLGAFRIGHFREPFSMDALTSGNSLALIERSLIQDAFVPFRNTGMQWANDLFDERFTVTAGFFRDNSNLVGADAGDGQYAYTGRLTWNPWYSNDGLCAFHLGMAGSWRVLPRLNAQGNPVAVGPRRVRFATRPEFRVNAPNFADTGFFLADSEALLGLETGFSYGPFLLQAEYVGAWVQDAVAPGGARVNPFFQGWYAQASWFLTGENRPYNRKIGIFGQLKPFENYYFLPGEDGRWLWGRGAWELAMRYSELDLDNRGILGGNLRDVTVGLNWYLSPNSRFMWNWIHVMRDAPNPGSSGITDILGMRFQVDF